MNKRYIKINVIILFFLSVFIGCSKECDKNPKMITNTEINTLEKEGHIDTAKIINDVNIEVLETFKVMESDKNVALDYNTYADQYANLSDEVIDKSNWWLYTEYDSEYKPYIYRINTKTGNRLKVCKGNIRRKKLLQEDTYYINESGIKVLSDDQKINLINKPIKKYQEIKDGYVYLTSDTLYYFNTLTNTESILDTFNNSIINADITAVCNNDKIIYCIKANGEIKTKIYDINTKSNKTILEDQFCNKIISCGNRLFLFIDSNNTIYVYEDNKIKKLVINAYPTNSKVIYHNGKIYFASDRLYILDVNNYSINSIDTYCNDNYLLDFQDQNIYMYGKQLMTYDIDTQELVNNNIYLNPDKESIIDNNSVIQIDDNSIEKMEFNGDSYNINNLDTFTEYFIGQEYIFLINETGILIKIYKDNLEKII